eukprot:scaffold124311_cov69-Phaeocystis_antarctica.AAC.1
MAQWSNDRLGVSMWVLEQPRGRSLATRLGGVAAFALLHLAVQPRGLLRVLVEPPAPLCVRPGENAARLLRPQQGRPAKHDEPATVMLRLTPFPSR